MYPSGGLTRELVEVDGIASYATRAATPQLRSGRNGLPRARVSEIQRGRMLSAAVEVVEEVGYARMTVSQVIGRARISRKTFYDVFADREDCFLAAFEQALSRARLRAGEAYEREADWREGIRSALARLLLFIDEEPALARLCVVEALGAGERVLERRSQVLDELAQVIDRGRLATSATREPAGGHGRRGGWGDLRGSAHTRAGGSQGVADGSARPVDEHDRAALSGSRGPRAGN